MEYCVQFLVVVSTEHGYTGIAEMRYTFEEGRSRQMTAYVKYTPVFIYAVNALANLSAQYRKLFCYGEFFGYTILHEGFHFMEYPGCTD